MTVSLHIQVRVCGDATAGENNIPQEQEFCDDVTVNMLDSRMFKFK